jgi:tRNA(Arg) A34 adenosine deaminase TadA
MCETAMSNDDARDRFFMQLAMAQAQIALDSNEVPVGCVFVWRDRVLTTGFNETNVSHNVQ